MKKLFIICLCALALTACNKKENSESLTTDSKPIENVEQKKEIISGKKFLVVNELNNKNIKIQAHETNLSTEIKHYYQIEIENLSDQVINIKPDQIVLFDSDGREIAVGLIDRELSESIAPQQSIKGIVAFDNTAVPKYLKFKN